jgi:hypothetical protein
VTPFTGGARAGAEDGRRRNQRGEERVKTREQIAMGFVALTIVMANVVMVMSEFVQATY